MTGTWLVLAKVGVIFYINSNKPGNGKTEDR